MMKKHWSIYLIRNGQNALYTGITTDIERRLQQHLLGKGAKALRGKPPSFISLPMPTNKSFRGIVLRISNKTINQSTKRTTCRRPTFRSGWLSCQISNHQNKTKN